ncbi:hypothetical protein J5N97_028854 [Dioscorea zingiberensis]|uniref:PUB2-4-like N-terminal domain-containing protein n=1 Tax=Dioscorea zingiberensis TaxID=325984 RepID=A0A9D5C075_9LILI|nr:hypothetical protein J5N97_028854 [Dioscorea zingiberensis]
MDRGALDGEILGGLVNSVSRFIHFAACQNLKSAGMKDFRNMVGILKLLKVVLDEAFNSEILMDEQLTNAVEKLDAVVNEAREILERRPQRMSKICSVLQTEPILLKVQKFSSEICNKLSELQQSSSFSSHSSSIQHCMQELQSVEQGLTSELIEIALKDQSENIVPSLEDVIRIMETLGLASNEEFLTEMNQQSCCHSKSESMSSTISSIDIPSKFDEKVSLSEEITCPSTVSLHKDADTSPWSSQDQLCSFKNRHNIDIVPQSSLLGSKSDNLTIISQVQKLIEDLQSRVPQVQSAAASELRLLAKHDKDNRDLIAECGAIAPLVSLLYSKIKRVQENAVTALLNLSINDSNKVLIAEAGAIEPLIQVLESGNTEARENAAATLFSLSVLEEYKVKIGRTGAVKALVYLLGFGSLRGKKDAAAALFNLSIYHENKARIVKAGAM